MVHTSGGTHRSRPTNHMGSPLVFVGDDAHIVPAVASIVYRCIVANTIPHIDSAKFDGAACGPTPQGGLSWPVGPIHLLWASAPTGCIRYYEPIHCSGHTEPGSGGAEGPLALSPQQCEAWIECVTAPIQSHRTKSLKNLKIPKLKSFTRFFSKNRRGPGGSAPGRAAHGAKLPLAASQRNTPGGGLPYCSGSQKLRFRSTPPSMPETVPSLVYCHIWKS